MVEKTNTRTDGTDEEIWHLNPNEFNYIKWKWTKLSF
jgi:hypothetical protein